MLNDDSCRPDECSNLEDTSADELGSITSAFFRLQRGEQDALGIIVERFEAKLLAQAARSLGTPVSSLAGADDILQDSLLAFWERLHVQSLARRALEISEASQRADFLDAVPSVFRSKIEKQIVKWGSAGRDGRDLGWTIESRSDLWRLLVTIVINSAYQFHRRENSLKRGGAQQAVPLDPAKFAAFIENRLPYPDEIAMLNEGIAALLDPLRSDRDTHRVAEHWLMTGEFPDDLEISETVMRVLLKKAMTKWKLSLRSMSVQIFEQGI